MSFSYNLFKKASLDLGIAENPSNLEIFVREKYQGKFDPSSLENISYLQDSENIFGEYYELVRTAATELKNDSSALLWAKVVSEYIFHASCEKARALPIPELDGTLMRDMIALLIMIPSMLEIRKLLESRGFDNKRIDEHMKTFQNCLAATERKIGRPAHDSHYFKWTILYLKGMIFFAGGFKFEIKKLPKSAIYLQNIKDKQIIPVMMQGVFHRTGAVLGSAGLEDEKDSFTAQFFEDESTFTGYPVENGSVLRQMRVFPKNEWEIFAAPGDCVLGTHIPKGADISSQGFDAAIKEALRLVREYYKEYSVRCLFCHSWLLDNSLADIIGNESKIVKFGDRFMRIPVKSKGKEVFNFVFTSQVSSLEELPENTRLERGLKSLYLGGGYVHGYEGVAKFVDLD